MAKETEREEIKEETHELEDEEKDELEDEEDEDVYEEAWNEITFFRKRIENVERSSLLAIPWSGNLSKDRKS